MRRTMFIQCNDSKVELPDGSSAKDLAEKLNLREPHQAVAVTINGDPKDLLTELRDGDQVNLLDFETKEGKEVFWHSSAHVLAQAVLRLWPDALPTIGPPIAQGFYYDFANLSISIEDFPKIEKEIQKIIKENFKTEFHLFKDKKEAIAEFGNNPFKKELIESFDEGSPVTAYRQGEFFDLCRGPHLFNLGKIKAFKLLKTSGAYWRGDSDKEMLTRIYGISFPDRQMMKDHLHMLAEAKKWDHRVIGNKLNLFSFREEAPGMPFIHPQGMIIWEAILAYWNEVHQTAGYEMIKTPQMMSKELWVRSGHWEHYRENMYLSLVDDQEFAIKPMNCPGCMLYYKAHKHSYRELPLKIAEVGHVHRHEPSGAINGMFRVRCFHQDDAHVFMKPDDIKEEILNVLSLTQELYLTFGLEYSLELSTRPEKSIGTDQDWEMTTKGLRDALEEWDAPYRINEGDGAFYGPKIDIHIHDAIGRAWQCGTIQLDMSLPEKFELVYTDKDGEAKRPIMIHRAIFGSIERFFGILTEHFAGKFPLWMSPRPVRIVPVADRHVEYAEVIQAEVIQAEIRCEIDDSHESVSKKIRNAQLDQVNYMLTIGDQEVENQTASLRTRDNVVHGEIVVHEFLGSVLDEYISRSLHSPYTKED